MGVGHLIEENKQAQPRAKQSKQQQQQHRGREREGRDEPGEHKTSQNHARTKQEPDHPLPAAAATAPLGRISGSARSGSWTSWGDSSGYAAGNWLPRLQGGPARVLYEYPSPNPSRHIFPRLINERHSDTPSLHPAQACCCMSHELLHAAGRPVLWVWTEVARSRCHLVYHIPI